MRISYWSSDVCSSDLGQTRARIAAGILDRGGEDRLHPVARRPIGRGDQVVDPAEIMAQQPRRHPRFGADRPHIRPREAMVGQARRRRLDQRGAAGIGAFARKGLAGGSHIVIHMYNKDRFMATLRDTFDTIDPLPADSLDGWSLPAWTYSDPDFHAVEMERIFRPSWQVVCHDSDIPNPGDWHSIDYAGESVILVRGTDRVVRAFANVCRHRGSRLVDGAAGCAKKLVCPYHAWTYELDGRLSGVPDSASYPTLDKGRAGLAPVEAERRSEEHTSELQSLMRTSYAVFCLKKKTKNKKKNNKYTKPNDT